MATPTTSTEETFLFAYQLSGSQTGTFTLVDSNSSNNGNNHGHVDPIAGNIKVKDPDGGTVSDGQNLKINVNHGNTADPGIFDTGKFTFIETATVQDGNNTLTGIVIEDKSSQTYFFLTNDQYTGPSTGGQGLGKHGNGEVSSTGSDTTICFMAGTLIRTPNGEVAVETLKRGDLVLTHDGRSIPVDWLGIQTISMRFANKMRVLPIRIRAGALAENVPARDLLVSPDHAILVEGALIHASALVNGTSIIRETAVPQTFTYYHVEVEDHSLILAENTPAETFVDNVDRLGFDNWAEHEALYPNGKQIDELPYPRAKSHRQVPVRTRVMLADRAQAFGADVAGAA